MWNDNFERFLMEERQRTMEAELRRQQWRREVREARAGQPGALRRGVHFVGVGLERLGHRLQVQCRDALAVTPPAAQHN